MAFTDVAGQVIDIGDIILYTMSTDGAAAAMKAGEVVKFNPKSIVVQPVEPDTFDPIMVEDFFMRETGRTEVRWRGQPYEYTWKETEKVVTGQKPKEQQLIPKPEPYRFYIVRKV